MRRLSTSMTVTGGRARLNATRFAIELSQHGRLPDVALYLTELAAIVALAVAGWVLATARRNVSVVDSLWGPFFPLATAVYVAPAPCCACSCSASFVWALRLSACVTWRNWGEPEVRRDQAIRAGREPGCWRCSARPVQGRSGPPRPVMEKNIGERRPAYADYIAGTPALVPGRPRASAAQPR